MTSSAWRVKIPKSMTLVTAKPALGFGLMETVMDYREKSFKEKLASAGQHLGVEADQIVSLKLRSHVSSYQEYQELVDNLHREAHLDVLKLDAQLQGRGWLLDDGHTKVIVVEHETGLEILYIAGSIASLITLVPLILKGWHTLRGHIGGRHRSYDADVEIRRLDVDGHLQEDRIHAFHAGPLGVLDPAIGALAAVPGLIEKEIHELSQQIRKLGIRVDTIEKQIRRKQRHADTGATKRQATGRKERRAKSERE